MRKFEETSNFGFFPWHQGFLCFWESPFKVWKIGKDDVKIENLVDLTPVIWFVFIFLFPAGDSNPAGHYYYKVLTLQGTLNFHVT